MRTPLRLHLRQALAIGLVFACGCRCASAAGEVATAEELRAALAAAKPGTTILVAAGEYRGFHAAGLGGGESRPIVIAAADRASPPVFTSGLHLSDVAFLELRDLVVAGADSNGVNVDDGGSRESASHHVTLRRLAVRDAGAGSKANVDGIKLSGVDDFAVLDCTIERWGRGGSGVDMVGCHRGTIEGCAIVDSATDPAASGIQAKGGSRDVKIARCRFEHAGRRAVSIGGSTGREWFRPAPTGSGDYEAKDVTVEDCTFVGSDAPLAFVGADGALVRRNTLYLPSRNGLRILQETRDAGFVPCRNGRFVENLVVYRRSDLREFVNVGPGSAPETFELARNYWYCLDAPARSIPARAELPVEERDPAGGADPRFVAPEAGDLRLAPDSPARGFGARELP